MSEDKLREIELLLSDIKHRLDDIEARLTHIEMILLGLQHSNPPEWIIRYSEPRVTLMESKSV